MEVLNIFKRINNIILKTMMVHYLWPLCVMVRFWLMVITGFICSAEGRACLVFAYAFTIMGAGFLWKSFTGSNDEVQLGKVFWHETRALHAILHLLAGYYLYIGNVVVCMSMLSMDIMTSIMYRVLMDK